MLELMQHAGDDTVLPLSLSRDNTTVHTQIDLKNWQLGTLKPKPLNNLGVVPIRPTLSATIDQVVTQSPAELAGLKPNDTVIQLDNEPIHDWYELSEMLHDRADQDIELTLLRDGQSLSIKATTSSKFGKNFKRYGYLGIRPQQVSLPDHLMYTPQVTVLSAIPAALSDTLLYSQFHAIMIGKILAGNIGTVTWRSYCHLSIFRCRIFTRYRPILTFPRCY